MRSRIITIVAAQVIGPTSLGLAVPGAASDAGARGGHDDQVASQWPTDSGHADSGPFARGAELICH
jgi:hypothetical protein